MVSVAENSRQEQDSSISNTEEGAKEITLTRHCDNNNTPLQDYKCNKNISEVQYFVYICRSRRYYFTRQCKVD